jgi:hypothetical protein
MLLVILHGHCHWNHVLIKKNKLSHSILLYAIDSGLQLVIFSKFEKNLVEMIESLFKSPTKIFSIALLIRVALLGYGEWQDNNSKNKYVFFFYKKLSCSQHHLTFYIF